MWIRPPAWWLWINWENQLPGPMEHSSVPMGTFCRQRARPQQPEPSFVIFNCTAHLEDTENQKPRCKNSVAYLHIFFRLNLGPTMQQNVQDNRNRNKKNKYTSGLLVTVPSPSIVFKNVLFVRSEPSLPTKHRLNSSPRKMSSHRLQWWYFYI